ncbi:MAG: hypothetical protein HC913_14145 [Microscillaceae bacterium]|nr:hypothetical protein [Microscillaceae bacterium]
MSNRNKGIFVAGMLAVIAWTGLWLLLREKAKQPYSSAQKQAFFLTQRKVFKANIRAMRQAHEQWSQEAFKTPDTIRLAGKANFRHFLFENQNLVFWSDVEFVPERAWLAGNYFFKVAEFEKSLYLITQSSQILANDTLRAYTLYPLYRHYVVRNAYLKPSYDPRWFPDEAWEVAKRPLSEAQNIYSPRGEFLFALQWRENKPFPQAYLPWVRALLFWLGLVGSLVFIFGKVQTLCIISTSVRAGIGFWAMAWP